MNYSRRSALSPRRILSTKSRLPDNHRSASASAPEHSTSMMSLVRTRRSHSLPNRSVAGANWDKASRNSGSCRKREGRGHDYGDGVTAVIEPPPALHRGYRRVRCRSDETMEALHQIDRPVQQNSLHDAVRVCALSDLDTLDVPLSTHHAGRGPIDNSLWTGGFGLAQDKPRFEVNRNGLPRVHPRGHDICTPSVRHLDQ